jgi:hypothetical protein
LIKEDLRMTASLRTSTAIEGTIAEAIESATDDRARGEVYRAGYYVAMAALKRAEQSNEADEVEKVLTDLGYEKYG